MDSGHFTWEELFLQFYGWMCAYAKSLTRGHIDRAQDLVHDTIVLVLNRGRDPNELNSPRAYVTRVMQNAFKDSLRKSKRSPLENAGDADSVGLQKDLISQPELERDLEKQELLDAIRREMARLPLPEKNLLELMLDGKTYEDISEILGRDIRIVRADCSALKSKLRYRFRNKGQ